MRDLSISEIEQVSGALNVRDSVAAASAVALAGSMLYPAAVAVVTAAAQSPITATAVGGVVVLASLIDPTLGLGIAVTSAMAHVLMNSNDMTVAGCH